MEYGSNFQPKTEWMAEVKINGCPEICSTQVISPSTLTEMSKMTVPLRSRVPEQQGGLIGCVCRSLDFISFEESSSKPSVEHFPGSVL